jgi:2-methylisocitrate lyase-like PEP mutase family enzyme
MSSARTNEIAKSFKALHVPGKPLILVNVHDASSARIIASLPECKALATASYSVALVNNKTDPELDLETQLAAVKNIATVAKELGKPLTVDLQDGYGNRLEEAVEKMIALGVVGINLEDADSKGTVMDERTAVDRVKRALDTAQKAGIPDFVVNARSDTYFQRGTLEESIRRGKLYLQAGATAIYVLPPAGTSLSSEDIKQCVAGLNGKVNVGVRLPKAVGDKPLTSGDLASLGISRISIGPQLYFASVEAMKKAAGLVFDS